MDRGEVWWADLPPPVGRRPVLIVTRSAAVAVRNQVVVAQVTRTAHGMPCEVARLVRRSRRPPCISTGPPGVCGIHLVENCQ